jgi:hypothetical protein
MGMVRRWQRTLKNVKWTRALVSCLNVCECVSNLSRIYHGWGWSSVWGVSHPFRLKQHCNWVLCLRSLDWEIRTEASDTISLRFSKKGWLCKYKRLSLWGGCLEQLGRMGRACLSPTPDDPWFSKRELPEGSDPLPINRVIYLGLHVEERLKL